MEVRLSAWSTVVMKFIFPILWIGGFGYGTLMLWVQPEEIVFNGVKGSATLFHQILFLVGFIAGTGFLLRHAVPLKRVTLTPRGLLVSNYFQEIRVPVDHVVQVRQSRNVRPPILTLILREPSEFGSEIRFLPSDEVPPTFLEEHEIARGFRKFAENNGVPRDDKTLT